MRKILPYILTVLLLTSCGHTPTRAERIEKAATEYLQRTTYPMSDYTIVSKEIESSDNTFMGFVGYRCTISNHYSAYKVVFVGVKGDSIVYVGTSEDMAKWFI